jgi:beta-galactosidase
VGIDYNTAGYDAWKAQGLRLPVISSETSSAVSDRGEYANDPVRGYVKAYDTEAPGWGQTAEGAWGGVGEAGGQGILTRAFVAGGWTWTGWDYRGEPTPYQWPNVNSHFGILDMGGFPKDRFYWYKAWFRAAPSLHVFPHWSWGPGAAVDVWVFSNAVEVELFVNGVSQGRKPMPQFAHAAWPGVKWAPGTLRAVGYGAANSSLPVSEASHTTAGAPAALRLSVKDGVGAAPAGGAGVALLAGCNDAALLQVEVLDAHGVLCPNASVPVSFTVSAPLARIAGTANGDPSGQLASAAAERPTFHGLVMAVVLGGTDIGTATVTASAPGFPAVSLPLTQALPPRDGGARWCPAQPLL